MATTHTIRVSCLEEIFQMSRLMLGHTRTGTIPEVTSVKMTYWKTKVITYSSKVKWERNKSWANVPLGRHQKGEFFYAQHLSAVWVQAMCLD
jgi:hypothetical protein